MKKRKKILIWVLTSIIILIIVIASLFRYESIKNRKLFEEKDNSFLCSRTKLEFDILTDHYKSYLEKYNNYLSTNDYCDKDYMKFDAQGIQDEVSLINIKVSQDLNNCSEYLIEDFEAFKKEGINEISLAMISLNEMNNTGTYKNKSISKELKKLEDAYKTSKKLYEKMQKDYEDNKDK